MIQCLKTSGSLFLLFWVMVFSVYADDDHDSHDDSGYEQVYDSDEDYSQDDDDDDSGDNSGTDDTFSADKVTADALMDKGQRVFPEFFPSSQSTQVLSFWLYRFYPETGIYLGVNQEDANVYLMGGGFGNSPYRVGTISQVNDLLDQQSGQEPVTNGDYTLLAWNDLGMHCVDGKDYSVFSILPPYNNLIAQLLDKQGGLVTQGVELTYESIADARGSINTYSAPTQVGQIEKTNFWDYVLQLFGSNPEPNQGLNLNDPTISNRTPGLNPLPMEFNADKNWFQAEGLPITPMDDDGNTNFYPMVKVTAWQGNTILATTKTVLPVSDEMTCKSCHRSTTDPSELANAARPIAGWVFDSDIEKDWKFNILQKHDDKLQDQGALGNIYRAALAAKGFSENGLYATATDSNNPTPVLCASCHGSNALGTTSYPGVQPLTQALHSSHGKVSDPVSVVALNDSANRDSCYLCHPGSETQCLRGAMGNAKDGQGNATMSCQSCHGDMQAVGSPERQGWFEEPTCQSCHHDGQRLTRSLDANNQLIVPVDRTFASNSDTPAPGLDLYRFSTGHGGLQCEACHGATHAVYPSSHDSDNVQSIELQGHAGTVNECTACHTDVPLTTSGGPHGMHTIGDAWIERHEDVAERNPQACAYCHGTDYRGSPLSEIKVSKTFRVEGRNKTFASGHQSNCYDCHNGPDGDD